MGMTREQFAILVKAMKATYTAEGFIPDADAFNVWYALLSDLDYKVASAALRKYMMTSKKIPTPADLREQALALTSSGIPDDQSELAAWALVRQAISNSSYHSEEEFAKLPPLIQKVIGYPANLREMAGMDMDTVNSVEQSHFMRSYRAVVARERDMAKLSPALREIIEKRTLMAKDTAMIEGSNE